MMTSGFTPNTLKARSSASCMSYASGIFSGCPNQEIGWPFIFKGLIIWSSSYFGVDSATKKNIESCVGLPHTDSIYTAPYTCTAYIRHTYTARPLFACPYMCTNVDNGQRDSKIVLHNRVKSYSWWHSYITCPGFEQNSFLHNSSQAIYTVYVIYVRHKLWKYTFSGNPSYAQCFLHMYRKCQVPTTHTMGEQCPLCTRSLYSLSNGA
jgi:hypothetical protein